MAAFEVVPMWDGTTATLDAEEQRVKLNVMPTKKDEKSMCGTRLPARRQPESDSVRLERHAHTDPHAHAHNPSEILRMSPSPCQHTDQHPPPLLSLPQPPPQPSTLTPTQPP